MKKINIAVIGIGHLGSKHLKVYNEMSSKVNVVGICDLDRDRTSKFAEHYQTPFFQNYKDLAEKVDAVDICVPTILHYEIAKFFLTKKIHAFVEKPITYTLKEADSLIQLADKNKLKLQIGHVERFNSAFEAVRHFAQSPLFIECHRLNHFPNRSLDIGVVMDLMIHDIDIVMGLNQCSITEIRAVGINVLTNREDIANVRLTFKNGCVCNLTASRVSDEVMRKIRIFLKNTYISLDYVQQEAFIYKRHENNILKHALPIEKEEPLKKELTSFLDCILENKTPVVSGREGREALKVALDISKQIWKNRPHI
ncbi:MAG: Gfo/Idh/MocA family oxidoreductase [Candidatus Omnitrophota bacterium]